MSEERLGVLLPKQEELCAKALDFWFKFRNPLIETFDYSAFLLMIRFGDNHWLQKIKPEWKEKIIPVIDAGLERDVEKVRLLVTDLINSKIDLKRLDDFEELAVFDQFTKLVATAINFYVSKTVKLKIG